MPVAGLLASGFNRSPSLPGPGYRASDFAPCGLGWFTSYSGGTAPDLHRLPFSASIYRGHQQAVLIC